MARQTTRLETRILELEADLERARAGLLVRAQELEVANKALEAQGRKWQAILASMADGVVVTDHEGGIVCQNPAAETILSEADGIFLGDGRTRCPPDDLPHRRALRGDSVDDAEIFVRNARLPQGAAFSVNARPLRDELGVVLGGVAVFRDITERRRLNAALEEQSRLKSEFVANMSHELRSPLNAILGFAELLHGGGGGPLAPRQREWLGEIIESSRHLKRLIDDVLDLAKVEAGKLSVLPEPCEMAVVVEDVCSVLDALAARKRIRIERQVDPEVQVVTDAGRMKQVLYNYVSNAIKFTPEGGRIRVRVKPEGAESFALEVEDDGIGIHGDDRARLFGQFVQLDAGVAKRHGGTGLGLALTKRIVELLGGRVGVRDASARGSIFFAVLPRVVAGGEAPRAAPPLLGPRRPARTRRRVLVVDDNAANRELVRALLEADGHEVRAAADAAETEAALAGYRPELILMDIQLPGTDGLELTRRLRADPAHRETAIVALTAYAMKGDEQKALAAGCDGYITKPIDTRTFAGMVLGYVRPAKRAAAMVSGNGTGSRGHENGGGA